MYYEPAFPLLLDTLGALLVKDGAVCWLGMKKRRKADGRFVGRLRKRFAVREVEREGEGEMQKEKGEGDEDQRGVYL